MKIYQFYETMKGPSRDLVGSALDHSYPPVIDYIM